jgi:hypothetical protein
MRKENDKVVIHMVARKNPLHKRLGRVGISHSNLLSTYFHPHLRYHPFNIGCHAGCHLDFDLTLT